MSGGIGDALIALGSAAPLYDGKKVGVVREHQVPLIKKLRGLDEVIEDTRMRDLKYYKSFDEVINFAGFCTTASGRYLAQKDYYACVEDKINQKIDYIGELDLPGDTNDYVCLHPGASNRNRRWFNDDWEKVAFALRNAGYKVAWLGPRNEFGFNSEGIVKLSDQDESLLGQARFLANSAGFIGTDSGFAHIAGIAGIDGWALFFSTSPEVVTKRYPTIKSILAYEMANVPATMVIDPDCEHAKAAREALSAEKVCETLGISPDFSGKKYLPQLLHLNIIGYAEKTLISHLQSSAKVTLGPFDPQADINITVQGPHGDFSDGNIRKRAPLDLRIIDRAIWEFRASSLSKRGYIE